ncbi:MAG: tetrahydromethanopterin S-methyltransferase subunit A [Methanomassiliicoccus sp.]|nr:tetrahydromethanopterin S-methyltransferase subunit A [Methanomassiliicoccus sp.]
MDIVGKVELARPEEDGRAWPLVPGDYVVSDPSSPVAVLIIGRGRVDLEEGYAIKGTMKTENMGLEKVVTNIVSNHTIRFLIVCGREEFGHFPANAILSLHRNGVDDQMRIIGSRSAIPFLCNLSREAVERFRQQVEVVDLVHVKEVTEIVAYDPEYVLDPPSVEELARAIKECRDRDPGPLTAPALTSTGSALRAEGESIARQLNRLADDFVGQMLRMPSERLSTWTDIAIVSSEFRVILDPVDGVVRMVPSVELAGRLQRYLKGVQ